MNATQNTATETRLNEINAEIKNLRRRLSFGNTPLWEDGFERDLITLELERVALQYPRARTPYSRLSADEIASCGVIPLVNHLGRFLAHEFCGMNAPYEVRANGVYKREVDAYGSYYYSHHCDTRHKCAIEGVLRRAYSLARNTETTATETTATETTETNNTPSTDELLEQIRELRVKNRTLTAQNKSLEDSARHYKEMFEHYAEMADRATERAEERKDRITELEAEVTKLETRAENLAEARRESTQHMIDKHERYINKRDDRIEELEAEVTKLESEAYIARYEKQCEVEIVPPFERYMRRWLEGYKNGNAYTIGDEGDTTTDDICITENATPVSRLNLELDTYLIEKDGAEIVVSYTPTGWLAVTV